MAYPVNINLPDTFKNDFCFKQKGVDMKKAFLYKPETDDISVNVAVYANEAFIDWGCSKNTTGCGKKCKDPWPGNGFDFFCKTRKGETNQACPID
jgi:hypothetical protein